MINVFDSFVILSKNSFLLSYLLVKMNFMNISLHKYSHIVFNNESLVSFFINGFNNLLNIISKVLLNSSISSSSNLVWVNWIDLSKSSIIDSINIRLILSS